MAKLSQDDGSLLTLGIVAALAVVGAVRRRGSRSDDEWLEAVPVGYSEKSEIARLVKQGSIPEAHRLNKSVFGVYGLGRDLQLQGANLRGADLQGVDLEGAYLEGANLEGANLEGADLEGTILEGANLQGANLQGAKLEGSDLRGADLRGANLRGANLLGASLIEANLRGANLEGANLTHAQGLAPHYSDLKRAKITNIYYDATTTWPRGFTPPRSRRTR